MKKLILGVLICSAFLIGLTGCVNDENVKGDATLNDVYNKIGDYFGDENADRSNLGAYYLDTEKNVVVVVLIDNSKEKQDIFKKLAKVDSKYLKFVQGGPYNTSGKK